MKSGIYISKIIAAICFISLLTTGFTKGQLKTDSIDRFIREEMKARGIPGLQITVIRSGKIEMSAAYGLANVEHNVAVNDKTLFSINSATKAFTGVAIMQLVEEGKLDLEQPISTYIDSLPARWQNIAVWRLLDHTSGIPDFLDFKNGGYIGGLPFEEAWLRIRALPMEFTPGEKTSYNQTNYVLLGQIIEQLSSMKFETFVKEKQFMPAGMRLSNFGDSRDVIPKKAPTYAFSRETKGNFVKGETLERTWEEFPELRATAGINSIAEELAKWIIALQEGRLLKEQSSLDMMWTPRRLTNNAYGGWALGWVAKRNVAPRTVAGIGGSRSWFYVYPDHNLAIIVLTNMKSNGPENLASEVAGFYYHELKAANGGNYADAIIPLRVILEQEGYDMAVKTYKELKASDSDYFISERDLTNWGYAELLLNKEPLKAKEIFSLMTYLYPENKEAKEGREAAQKALRTNR